MKNQFSKLHFYKDPVKVLRVFLNIPVRPGRGRAAHRLRVQSHGGVRTGKGAAGPRERAQAITAGGDAFPAPRRTWLHTPPPEPGEVSGLPGAQRRVFTGAS